MRPTLVKTLALTSLLLCVAVLAMWTQSRSTTRLLGRWSSWTDGEFEIESCGGVFSDRGVLAFAAGTQRIATDRSPPSAREFARRGWISGAPGWPYAAYDGDGPGLRILDVHWKWNQQWDSDPPFRTHSYFRAPHWLLALLTGALPLLWIGMIALRRVQRWSATPVGGSGPRRPPARGQPAGA